MPSSAPIGVFDSGVGGLTVLSALATRLPGEDLIYFGDSARVPWGIKSQAVVTRFSREICRFLLRRNVKAIVVACNTASALALPELEAEVGVPILGVVEAGARRAVALSTHGRITVIGTESTIRSRAYTRAIEALSPDTRILSRACPLFVPMVEDGIVDGPVAETVVEHYLGDLREFDTDTVVLGCTHYPLLEPVIRQILGSGFAVADAAQGTAELLAERLLAADLLNPSLGQGNCSYFFSDRTPAYQRLARLILPGIPEDLQLVDVESREFREGA
ncbi:MAG: glutamate racemase [Calditrichaeota bacterium]|nr:glutamate racemase [Calditrichota bacterium]MCB9475204.1 glutamate racemase [Candidatus Delongbacteria bacterium]